MKSLVKVLYVLVVVGLAGSVYAKDLPALSTESIYAEMSKPDSASNLLWAEIGTIESNFKYISFSAKKGEVANVDQDCNINSYLPYGTYIQAELERWAGICEDLKKIDE